MQGAGWKGELEITLNFQLLNNYSSSPLPIPYSLFPTPYSLLPIPYSLNPTPSTLNPTPSTLNPTPSTLNPTPYSLNYIRSQQVLNRLPFKRCFRRRSLTSISNQPI